MTDEEIVLKELSEAIKSIEKCIPILESFDGKISTEILNKIDLINYYSTLF